MKYIFLFFISFHSFAQSNILSPAITLQKGGTQIYFGNDYFLSEKRIDSEGEEVEALDGESYQNLTNKFQLSFGVTDQLELGGGVIARYVQAEDTYLGDEKSFTAYEPVMVYARAAYSFAVDADLNYSIEGVLGSGLISSEEYSSLDEPEKIVVGDEGQYIHFGINLSKQTSSKNYIFGTLLYRTPGADLSSEVYANLNYMVGFKKFAFGIGVENVSSLNEDEFTDNPDDKPASYYGPTNLYNSINRSWTKPYIKLTTFGKRLNSELMYSKTVAGTSTDLGTSLALNFIYRKELDNKFAKKNSRFKEYALEGLVTKIGKSKKSVLIDKGVVHGVKKGMRVDFYSSDFLDKNELVATGVVLKVQASRSLVALRKQYSKKKVEEGSIAQLEEL